MGGEREDQEERANRHRLLATALEWHSNVALSSAAVLLYAASGAVAEGKGALDGQEEGVGMGCSPKGGGSSVLEERRGREEEGRRMGGREAKTGGTREDYPPKPLAH